MEGINFIFMKHYEQGNSCLGLYTRRMDFWLPSLVSCLSFPWRCSIRTFRMENNNNVNLKVGDDGSRGACIVLDGLDRSGKTSQCSKLLSYLEGLGHPTELWLFPDRSTTIGQMISAYLSNQSQLDDHTIHLLYSANRWEKSSLMETKLKRGTTLIVDWYSYSGVAFSSAKGLDFNWYKKAARRGGYRGERDEKLEFQRKVAESYQAFHDPSWKVQNLVCNLNADDIWQQIHGRGSKTAVLDHVLAWKTPFPPLVMPDANSSC